MSATNSRIAKIRRAQFDLQENYWNHKANYTVRETVHFTHAMHHLNELIEQEKLRTVDYLKAS